MGACADVAKKRRLNRLLLTRAEPPNETARKQLLTGIKANSARLAHAPSNPIALTTTISLNVRMLKRMDEVSSWLQIVMTKGGPCMCL